MTEPLNLTPIRARLGSTGPRARLEMPEAIDDITALLAEVDRLRTELEQTRQRNDGVGDRCKHEAWEAGPRRLIGRKAMQTRRCADCNEWLAMVPYTEPQS